MLESLGRLDEAMARDAESAALNPGESHPDALRRKAVKHMAVGEDAEAERVLRGCMSEIAERSHETDETDVTPNTVLAELLEGRGTEEALAEAKTLRDGVAQHLAEFEARRAAALEEMRGAAAEAVRRWRGDRIKAKGKKKGGKGKGKGKGKKKRKGGKAKGRRASPAAATKTGPSREAGGGEVAAAAVPGQQGPGGESQPQGEEEEEEEEEKDEKEECAICLQDLELEDDDEPWCDDGGEGEALVMLKCGHRFHAVCGDVWCAKCVDKGWGVTCPRCRAPYVVKS
jgi:hypothetical protein